MARSAADIIVSPLEMLPGGSQAAQIWLKREDLLEPAGGNKVHRFRAFFSRLGRIRRAVALSDPGAHSFAVLSQFLSQEGSQDGALRMTFLERHMPLSPYQRRLRQQYLDHPRIEVRSGPLWLQLLRFAFYKLFGPLVGARTIGIGGHVGSQDNRFAEVLEACDRQLEAAGQSEPEIVHVFPVASGNMADGFIRYIRAHGRGRHRLLGVVTGPKVAHARLKLRYLRAPEIELMRAERLSYADYLTRAEAFHQQSGVWLDPQHTIYLPEAIRRRPDLKQAVVVMWITCPRVQAPATS